MSKDVLSKEAEEIINNSDFYKMSYNNGMMLICDKCRKHTDARILGLCAECFKIADEKTVASS